MSRLLPLLSWLAFPVYVWQGVGVRLRTERMLPAKGRVLHHIPGKGPPFNLLVIGDSSAASVGIGSTDHGFAAQLARLVADETGRPVAWRAAGFNSATSGHLRDFVVPNLAAGEWTHIVLAVGTNDMKNFHTARRFTAEFGGLLYALRAKWPQARVVWSPVIDMRRVPALPPMLGRVLEIRARLINHLGTQLCLERGAVPASRLPVEDPAAGFSRDGFHASEAGYEVWARHMLPFVMGDPLTEAVSEPSAS
jgi:lysophospholipase L1-like esterase